jgi:folylpolyglutamate synthase/dihydropteroate synthase
MPASELASHVTAVDADRQVVACADVGAALDAALAASRTVCVAGSIFLAGAVRDRLLALPRRSAEREGGAGPDEAR